MLPKFEVDLPKTIGEAISNLSADKTALPVCGGTDLLVRLRAGSCAAQRLVYVNELRELHGISKDSNGLMIGAACTLSDIEADPLVREYASLLAEGCGMVGSPAIRNRGTIGGNAENASPAGDGLCALYGVAAQVVLASAEGCRRIPIEEYVTGPRRTCRMQDEIILGFSVPIQNDGYHRFFKVGRRNALAISVVNGCVSVDLQEGVLRNVRLVLGAVAPTPVCLSEISERLEGRVYTNQLDEQLQGWIEESIHPIDDLRAGGAYRKYIAGVMIRRALREATGCEA